jgi:hypothetical protein
MCLRANDDRSVLIVQGIAYKPGNSIDEERVVFVKLNEMAAVSAFAPVGTGSQLRYIRGPVRSNGHLSAFR